MSRRLHKVVVAAIVATTTICAAIVASDLTSTNAVDPGPAPTGIASVAPVAKGTAPAALLATAPAAPVMTLTTPANAQWWDYVAKFAPDLRLSKVKAPTSVPVRGYAYAMATPKDADMASALPLFGSVLISTASPADAATLREWANDASGHEYRRTYVSGDTLVLAPEWSDGADYDLDVAADPARKPAAAGRLEFHPGAWAKAVVDNSTDPGTAAVTSGIANALALTPGSAFAVAATTPNGPWTGTVEGLDPAKVNPGMLNAVIDSSAPVAPKATTVDPSGVTVEVEMLDSALARIASEGQWGTYTDGKATAPGDGPKPLTAVPATGAAATGTIPLWRLASYGYGRSVERTGPRLLDLQFDAAGNATANPWF